MKVVRKQCPSTVQAQIGKSGHIQARHSGSGVCGQNKCWWVSGINGGTCFCEDELEVIAEKAPEFKVGEWAEYDGDVPCCRGCQGKIVAVDRHVVCRRPFGTPQCHVPKRDNICVLIPRDLKPCPAPTEEQPEFKVGQWCEFIAHYPERERCWGCRAKIVQVLHQHVIVGTTTRTHKEVQCGVPWRCQRSFRDIAPCAAPTEDKLRFRGKERIRQQFLDYPTEDKPPQRGVERSCEMSERQTKTVDYEVRVLHRNADGDVKADTRVLPAGDAPRPSVQVPFGMAPPEIKDHIMWTRRESIAKAVGDVDRKDIVVVQSPFGQ